jgi:hypothetical protein
MDSETKGVVWFSLRLFLFRAFLFVVSMGKNCIYVKIKCNKRNNNVSFIGEQRDNVNKAKPPPTFSCFCRNLKSKI